MSFDFLELPDRTQKPRKQGLTSLIDNGTPLAYFSDVVKSYSDLIDFIKLGWGTAIVTPFLKEKLDIATKANINCYLGGTFFEKALMQNKAEAFFDACQEYNISHVEISDGTINIPHEERAAWIKKAAARFQVISEVGYKDPARSIQLHPAAWVDLVKRDLDSGACYVTLEARETGTSGICREDGELRFGLINELLLSGIPHEQFIFEAPTKVLQAHFLKAVGPNANLANIPFSEIVSLETLRLGLRADTLLDFE